MRALIRSTFGVILRAVAALLAPVFSRVARTGIGTESCLRHGFLPVPLHYYQPVFHPNSVAEPVWLRKHELGGLTFSPEEQIAFVETLAPFANECDWPAKRLPGMKGLYYTDNQTFGYSSACLLHSVTRLKAPARVVEVGAGMSTLVLIGALEANRREGNDARLISIDPYPSPEVRDLPQEQRELIATEVQDVPIETFTSLRAGDLLFIDSSHVVRTGGDVTFLYLDVLPRLAKGVVVHIHDIQLPYEYPRDYVARENLPRYFWSEQYLLQGFLAFNDAYRILLAAYFLQVDYPELMHECFPKLRTESHRPSSSFYMVRT